MCQEKNYTSLFFNMLALFFEAVYIGVQYQMRYWQASETTRTSQTS